MNGSKQSDVLNIYDKFLSKIADYTFLTRDDEDIYDELSSYLDSAIAEFYVCKKSLDIDEHGNFPEKLSKYEIEILVRLMMVDYMYPQMLSSETVRQSLSDADFKIYSQANQLRELSLLYRQMKKESRHMIQTYTFFDLRPKAEDGRYD